jgi:hypothetical protein
MRRLALSLVIVGCLAALLGGAASAGSHSRINRRVILFVNGWGSVRPEHGFVGHRTRNCTKLPDCGWFARARRQHVRIVATPYKGWKFAGWRLACRKNKTRTCSLDLSRFPCPLFVSGPPGYQCRAKPFMEAKFVPVAPGLTRKNPIPVGAVHDIGSGYAMRVESAEENVQLSAAPAAGEEYFDADVTLTYTGPGSSTPLDHLDLNAQGSFGQLYNADHGGGCPASDLQPRLDIVDPIASGRSATGHVCWTIATDDAATLEMFFGAGSQDHFPGTTWFALH